MTKQEFLIKWRMFKSSAFKQRYEADLDSVIEQAIADHEQGKKVIHAKALRKKGTDGWYALCPNEHLEEVFRETELPHMFFIETTIEGLIEWGYNLPTDAELINITIFVNNE